MFVDIDSIFHGKYENLFELSILHYISPLQNALETIAGVALL